MPSDQVVVYCKNCKKSTVQIKQRPNHILHLLLSLVTFGIWVIVWFFIALSTSDTPQCTVCDNELISSKPKQSNKKETKYKKDSEAKSPKISKFKIAFIIIAILLVIGIFFPDEERKKRLATENKEEIEKKQKGLHCLSGWDGAYRPLVVVIKNNLRDPDSFKHRTTTITPGKTSAFFVLMTYGAKNGFGGYTTEFASARIDMNCNLLEAMNQKMETIR